MVEFQPSIEVKIERFVLVTGGYWRQAPVTMAENRGHNHDHPGYDIIAFGARARFAQVNHEDGEGVNIENKRAKPIGLLRHVGYAKFVDFIEMV